MKETGDHLPVRLGKLRNLGSESGKCPRIDEQCKAGKVSG